MGTRTRHTNPKKTCRAVLVGPSYIIKIIILMFPLPSRPFFGIIVFTNLLPAEDGARSPASAVAAAPILFFSAGETPVCPVRPQSDKGAAQALCERGKRRPTAAFCPVRRILRGKKVAYELCQ